MDPTLLVLDFNQAPVDLAASEGDDHHPVGLGRREARVIRQDVNVGVIGSDQTRTPTGEEGADYPALGIIDSPNLAPVLKLGRDLKRSPGAGEDPVNRINGAGAAPGIGPASLEGDEPGQRQIGFLTDAWGCGFRWRTGLLGSSLGWRAMGPQHARKHQNTSQAAAGGILEHGIFHRTRLGGNASPVRVRPDTDVQSERVAVNVVVIQKLRGPRVSKSQLKVVVTRKLPAGIERRLDELFDTRLRQEDTPMTRNELALAMAEADVLVPTITDTIDQSLLAKAGKKLRLIANYGAGFDHIDIETARQRGILVSNTPGVNSEDTADMALCLMLAVTRRLRESLQMMESGDWNGWAPTALMGTRLAGKSLGILGMGRVGTAVARRARVFGMHIHYHNRKRVHPDLEAELDARYWESLDQMVSRMDILSVNCPHTPATFHLLHARRLKLAKPDAVIINTSRGEVIDQNALTRMLKTRSLAGAGLDVFEKGITINPDLQNLKNVVLLPHIGSATTEGRFQMGEKVLINIKTHEDGHRPPDLVVPGMV